MDDHMNSLRIIFYKVLGFGHPTDLPETALPKNIFNKKLYFKSACASRQQEWTNKEYNFLFPI